MTDFEEDYYKSINYVDYLQRGEKYSKTAKDLQNLLSSVSLDNGKYLDYGCAVGHLIKGFNNLGKSDIIGYDISNWAIKVGKENNLAVTNDRSVLKDSYGVTFILDVLEHMEVWQIDDLFNELKTDAFVFRIPVVKNEGEDYVLECSKNDPTHIIRWTKGQWKKLFQRNGYLVLSINLSTVYDSEGVYCGISIKI